MREGSAARVGSSNVVSGLARDATNGLHERLAGRRSAVDGRGEVAKVRGAVDVARLDLTAKAFGDGGHDRHRVEGRRTEVEDGAVLGNGVETERFGPQL